jgi:hypothetical protein
MSNSVADLHEEYQRRIRMAETKIWKARMKKSYADETNHVVVGEVLEENSLYLKMRCRAFHFKRPTIGANIVTSEVKVRLFPWERFSYITELPEYTDWEGAVAGLDEKGDVILRPVAGDGNIDLKEGLDG